VAQCSHRFQVQRLRTLQLKTELDLLNAQVNQHFFNTLNNLHGLSINAPEQMPEVVLQLAGLMRYQLDNSRLATVTVGTEAEYLVSYVGLEKLRLRANTQVEFVADLPQPQ
jgi:LytS/YehU family sensor histidine kinase